MGEEADPAAAGSADLCRAGCGSMGLKRRMWRERAAA